MAILTSLQHGSPSERRTPFLATAASRLLRAYATPVEALRRLRNGGSQFVRVEHVHVNEGGQAVIGNVNSPEERVRSWNLFTKLPPRLQIQWANVGSFAHLQTFDG